MSHWLDGVVRLLNADTNDLRTLALMAGGDPRTFYRGVYLKGLDFRGQDLRGMEFAEFTASHALTDSETKLDATSEQAAVGRRVEEGLRKHSVFISHAARENKMSALARQFFVERGYEVVGGKMLEQAEIPESIIGQIAGADCFLALWSSDYPAHNAKSGWRPSPWVYFEYGAAVALGKPCQIFVIIDAASRPHRDVFAKITPRLSVPELTNENLVRRFTESLERFEKYFEGRYLEGRL